LSVAFPVFLMEVPVPPASPEGMRYADAHFHADDLEAYEPGLAGSYRDLDVVGLASAHDGAGLARTRDLLDGAGPWFLSFGIHPQLPVMDEAGLLLALASSGGLAAVGECGFDFFGDVPDRERTPANERRQRAVFEFQLELAEHHGLPVVLHLRRAMDLLFEYAPRLSRLPAVLLHSWGGPPNEASAFLSRCPSALFSFGTALLNGNKKARASAAALPASAILTETDAPYQPPREAPLPGARLARDHSTFSDLPAIIAAIAALRGDEPEALRATVLENFTGAFAHGL